MWTRYRTTTIEIDVLNSERYWLTIPDYEAWAKPVFSGAALATPSGKRLPAGVRITANDQNDGLVSHIAFDFVAPRKHIDRELQEMIFSIENIVPIKIAVSEGDLTIGEIHTLGLDIDHDYAEVVLDEME